MNNPHFCDLLPDDCPPEIPRTASLKDGTTATLTGAWSYPAAGQRPPLLHVRYDGSVPDDGGKPPKTMPWYHLRAFDEWVSGRDGHAAPLYGTESIRSGEPVIICEGEKSTNAARSVGANAVGLAGVGDAESVDLSPLQGLDVVLWPDNDDGGRTAMDAIAERLARAHRRVNPEALGLDLKQDAADMIAAGDIPDAAALWERLNPVMTEVSGPEPLPTLWKHMPEGWQDKVLPPQKFLFDGVFPVGYVSLLIGPGGLGKSWLTLIAAVSLVTGKKLLGALEPTGPAMKVVYLTLEDDFVECHRRLQKIFRAYGLNDDEARLISENLRLYPIPSFCCVASLPDGSIAESESLAAFKTEVADFGPGAVFMDPSSGLIGGLDENSNPDITAFLGLIRGAMPSNAATVAVCHVAKVDMAAVTTARGASAWTNSARQVVALRPLEQKEGELIGPDAYLHVAFLGRKANYSADSPNAYYMRKLTDEGVGGVLVDAQLQNVKLTAGTAENYMICSKLPQVLEEFAAEGGVSRLEAKGKASGKEGKQKGARFKNALSEVVGFIATAKAIDAAIVELMADGTLTTVTDSEHRKVLTLASKAKANQSGIKAEKYAAAKAENVLPLQGESRSPLFGGSPPPFPLGELQGPKESQDHECLTTEAQGPPGDQPGVD